MKTHASRSSHDLHGGPNMTPLVDVVMVILIFLMLAGSFGLHEHFQQSKSSMSGITCPPPDMTLPPQSTYDVFIGMRGDGAYTIQTSATGRLRDADALFEEMSQQRGRYVAAGQSPDDVQVVIHPSRDCPWDLAAQAHDAAVRAKFSKVGFAVAK